MTYEELLENPFSIPYGTKVEITHKDGTAVLCHFGGYRANAARIVDRSQLIPQFHEITHDGRMSRNVHVVTYSQMRTIKEINIPKDLFTEQEEQN